MEIVSDQPCNNCDHICYDHKFNQLIEVCGKDGLRFRQNLLIDSSRMQQRFAFANVHRYLNVPTTHLTFTPYNTFICLHIDHLHLVQHITGKIIHSCKLPNKIVAGAQFDKSSDCLLISDENSNCIYRMKYLEFEEEALVQLTSSIQPGILSINGNLMTLLNRSKAHGCIVLYHLDTEQEIVLPAPPILRGRQHRHSIVIDQRVGDLQSSSTSNSFSADEQDQQQQQRLINDQPARNWSVLTDFTIIADSAQQQNHQQNQLQYHIPAKIITISSEEASLNVYVKNQISNYNAFDVAPLSFNTTYDNCFWYKDDVTKIPKCITAIDQQHYVVLYKCTSDGNSLHGLMVLCPD